MALPPRFLDELKDRVGLADLIGRRVKLVRKGKEHLGLCPFHNEKTPSFTVNEDKGFYHCFGCGAHGGAIDFVMETERLNFIEAVERLAAQVGLAMPERTPEEREKERRRAGLAEAVDAAARWFADQLRGPAGNAARRYLVGRGVGEKEIGHFRLGFAPDSRDALKNVLTGQGFAEDMLVEAGLVIRPEDGRPAYDRFRGRIIFPIADRKGRAVAFGGRILEGDGPKYLNSPETPLFHKGHMLYNLDRAGAAAHGGADLIVVEGYMDVIALHRGGFEGAVAPLGTALTEEQIQALWRYANEPILCFDGDEAGRRAAARAADRALPLLKPGKSLRFAMLPPGKDPDDLIAGGGPAAMRGILDHGRPLSIFVWEQELSSRPVNTPERRADLQQRLRQRSRQIVDPAVQDYYWSAFRERLRRNFRFSGRSDGGRSRPGGFHGADPGGRALASAAGAPRRRQQVVLATLLRHPVLADEFSDALAGAAFDHDLDKLLQALQKHLAAEPDLDAETLKRHLSQDGFATLIEALFANDVMMLAPSARAGAPLETARRDIEGTLATIFQGRLMEELDATTRYTAEDPDEEKEARFFAFRQDVEASDRQIRDAADGPDASGRSDESG